MSYRVSVVSRGWGKGQGLGEERLLGQSQWLELDGLELDGVPRPEVP